MKSIDVVMPTFNSEKPCLKECLDAIHSEIPVHHLIVVDSGSNDNTVGIALQYPRTKLIVERGVSVAKARQIGIENVDTEFFAFVDSDVVLCRGWLENIMSIMTEETGAVEGLCHYKNELIQKYANSMLKLQWKLYHTKRIRSERAFTGDTIIRTRSVKGILIPEWLKVYEDQFIRWFVERNGFNWLRTSEPVAVHDNVRKTPKAGYEAGRCAHRLGYLSLKRAGRNFLTSIPKGLYGSFDNEDWGLRIFRYQTALYWNYLMGAVAIHRILCKKHHSEVECARPLVEE